MSAELKQSGAAAEAGQTERSEGGQAGVAAERAREFYADADL